MSRAMRGHGSIYRRGGVFWIQYSLRGKVYRESTHSGDSKVAGKLLIRRIGEVSRGRVIGPVAEKVTLADMAKALLVDYRLKGNRSVASADSSGRQLMAFFGGSTRALDLTADRLALYVEARQRAKLAGGSINRELSAIRRMFNLMIKAKRLSHDHMPAIPKLQEASPRRGFIEPAEFARLCAALPGYLHEPARFLYLTGWRKGSMRSLQWARDVELTFNPEGGVSGGTLRLQPENAKNKRASSLPIIGELLGVISRALEARQAESPFVFHHMGRPIGDFRKAWAQACKTAGLSGLLVHDFRRSCARNLVRSGVPERVAMGVTGHLTRSMFDRYNIVSTSDLESAMTRVSEYVTARAAETPKVVPLARKVA